MSVKYRPSTAEDAKLLEKPAEFVGTKISIYWDGDKVFYPATVLRQDAETNKYVV